MAKHDWNHWRHLYVTGGEDITLEALARIPDAPALSSLKERSVQEKWRERRAEYQSRVRTKVQERSAESDAEVALRHAKVGRTLVGIALDALKKRGIDTLSNTELIRLIQVGTDVERKALGLDTVNLNLDLKSLEDVTKLSDEELEAAQERVRLARLGIMGRTGEA